MTAQEYIESILKKMTEPAEQTSVGTTSLEDAILAKVLSKKFRKLRADQPAEFNWETISIPGLNGENFSKIRVLKPQQTN